MFILCICLKTGTTAPVNSRNQLLVVMSPTIWALRIEVKSFDTPSSFNHQAQDYKFIIINKQNLIKVKK